MDLWRIINAAVTLGKSIEHYATFNESKIENAIRKAQDAFLGKQPSPQGRAVEQIIDYFRSETQDEPTSLKVLAWLGGERNKTNDDEPLKVDHQLWGEVLEGVSWLNFTSLMKSAKKRIRPKGYK